MQRHTRHYICLLNAWGSYLSFACLGIWRTLTTTEYVVELVQEDPERCPGRGPTPATPMSMCKQAPLEAAYPPDQHAGSNKHSAATKPHPATTYLQQYLEGKALVYKPLLLELCQHVLDKLLCDHVAAIAILCDGGGVSKAAAEAEAAAAMVASVC